MTNNIGIDEVIDLTESFTLVNHHVLSDAVIELLDSDESFILSPVVVKKLKSFKSKPKCGERVPKNNKEVEIKEEVSNDNNHLLCPICWDTLGKNPAASTLCGHVFCVKCLKNSLKLKKECPTCRTKLKTSSYHPLYI